MRYYYGAFKSVGAFTRGANRATEFGGGFRPLERGLVVSQSFREKLDLVRGGIYASEGNEMVFGDV